MTRWLEKDSEKGFGLYNQFTNNEAIRRGLELSAAYMSRNGLSSNDIFDELVMMTEGEGIPVSIIQEVAEGYYILDKKIWNTKPEAKVFDIGRDISEKLSILGNLSSVDCGL